MPTGELRLQSSGNAGRNPPPARPPMQPPRAGQPSLVARFTWPLCRYQYTERNQRGRRGKEQVTRHQLDNKIDGVPPGAHGRSKTLPRTRQNSPLSQN